MKTGKSGLQDVAFMSFCPKYGVEMKQATPTVLVNVVMSAFL